MKIKINKAKSNLYVGIFILIIKTIFYYSTVFILPKWGDAALQYLAVFFLAIHILKQKYSKKTLFIYGLITLFALISCLLTKEWGILITVITVLAIRKEYFNDIIEFIYKIELFVVSLNIILSLIMSLFGFPITSTYYGQIVFTLGFVHRNSLAVFLSNLIFMWAWLNYEKLNIKHLFFITFIEILVLIFVKTKTSAVTVLFMILLIFFYKNKQSYSFLLYKLASLIVPSLSFFLYYLISHYGNTISILFDRLLTGRIKLNTYFFQNYGLTLAGRYIDNYYIDWNPQWQLQGKLTFDCTYTYLMISRGIIWLIIITFLFYRLAKLKNNKINLFIIIWALYAVTEIHGINCYICFPILLITLLFDNNLLLYNVRRN